jgi:protein-S-isoprenylcysteine O-methyltransferase Ste14
MAPARPLTAFVGSILFTVFVEATVALYLPLVMVRDDAVAPWWPVGAVVTLAGVALYLWCAGLFSFVGRGTPAPIAAPNVFVGRGPYRYVRNPMYIGLLTSIIGIAIAYASPWVLAYAVLVAIAFHFFVLGYEEPTLEERFGHSYEEYRRTVPRWIPRMKTASRTSG